MPLAGMRKAIAEHMHRSLQVSAQLTGMGEVDMTGLVKRRGELIKREQEIGTRVTYTDLLVFTVAKALRDYPMVNAAIIDNEIRVWEDISVGVAVSTEGGLIVPVIRNADQKSLVEISKAIKALAQRARERSLQRDEIQGGTFTISNLGARVGGWHFDTLIINQPESAILGTGGITERAVVRNGEVVPRPIMTYSFTYDHRLIDGVLAGEFMGAVVDALENPAKLPDMLMSPRT
jgi:pyruvate dehydrogenase E2 component (dihydrolipoamide acetyltransferase)